VYVLWVSIRLLMDWVARHGGVFSNTLLSAASHRREERVSVVSVLSSGSSRVIATA
jgi:hypothetical protein